MSVRAHFYAGQSCASSQAINRRCVSRNDMHEHVSAAGVRLDESEAFRCIEPFHYAGRHHALLSNRLLNLTEALFIARRGVGD